MNIATYTNLRNLGFVGGSCPVTNVVSPNISKDYPGGFHVSYCRSNRDYGCATTTIILKGRVFFVLNGNHAAALDAAAIAGGISTCMDYFLQNIALANPLSEHLMAVGLADDPFALASTTLEILGQSTIDRISQTIAAKE